MLAGIARERYDYETSNRLYQKTLEIQREVSEPDDPDLGNTVAEYAISLEAMARYEEAADALRESIAMQERSLGKNHLWVALSLGQLGDVIATLGRTAEGIAIAEDGLARAIESAGTDHHHTMTIRRYLAMALAADGQFDRAVELQGVCLEAYTVNYGPSSRRTAALLNDRAMVQLRAGNHAEAKGDVLRALDILSEANGTDNPGLAGPLLTLVRVRLALGETEEAHADARRAQEIMTGVYPDNHPNSIAIQEILGR
jgi:hypothetical protein